MAQINTSFVFRLNLHDLAFSLFLKMTQIYFSKGGRNFINSPLLDGEGNDNKWVDNISELTLIYGNVFAFLVTHSCDVVFTLTRGMLRLLLIISLRLTLEFELFFTTEM